MKKNKKFIVSILVITIILAAWGIKENYNKRIYKAYEYDIIDFQNNHKELMKLLEAFIETPNVENYSNIQYNMGTLMEKLIKLSSSMRECYKKDLLNVEKTYDEGRDIINLVGRLIKNSKNLIIQSITINNNQLKLNEDKIKLIYDDLNSINDNLKLYYDNMQ